MAGEEDAVEESKANLESKVCDEPSAGAAAVSDGQKSVGGQKSVEMQKDDNGQKVVEEQKSVEEQKPANSATVAGLQPIMRN